MGRPGFFSLMIPTDFKTALYMVGFGLVATLVTWLIFSKMLKIVVIKTKLHWFLLFLASTIGFWAIIFYLDPFGIFVGAPSR